ncbi:MAG: glutathione S-transferase family protein [Gammaproteobacteria bacterium]|nr:glutathione S-transferase family protein [Gammaproteobacteria bacterium]
MLTLFDYLPSQNAWKVRQLLNHLQRPYRTELVSIFEGEGKTDAYRRINPTGSVPAIRLENGCVLAESNAILGYLAEGTPYLPDDSFGRAKVQQWLFFEQQYVEPMIGSLRFWTMTGKLPHRSAPMIKARRSGSLKALQILNVELATRAFIAGDRYTIADLSLFAYASRAEEAGLSLQPYPAFRQWITRVQEQPGFLAEIYPYSIDPHSVKELG